MTFLAVPDKATGDVFTEVMWDSFIRDNLNKGVVRPVAQVTLAAPAALIDFTGIAADWAHLQLVLFARGDAAAVAVSARLRVNNDAAANYLYQQLSGNAATAAAAESFGETSMQLGQCPAASAGADLFGSCVVDIPHYTAAAIKNIQSSNFYASGTATANMVVQQLGGNWRSSAAISRLTVLPSSGNFVAGTRATLYGMGGI